eukprot:c8740_g2_i1.p1 GENE.c8740_g2_i1~~c8740_g2_i1.p1  ORF type:complete len:174 (-),score=38.01 c8740_g2_i1:105-626(-)
MSANLGTSRLWQTLGPEFYTLINQASEFVAQNGWLLLGIGFVTYYIFTTYIFDWIGKASVRSSPIASIDHDEDLQAKYAEQRRIAIERQQELLEISNEIQRMKDLERAKRKREAAEHKYQDVLSTGGRTTGSSDTPSSGDLCSRPSSSGAGFNPLVGPSSGSSYRPPARRRGG